MLQKNAKAAELTTFTYQSSNKPEFFTPQTHTFPHEQNKYTFQYKKLDDIAVRIKNSQCPCRKQSPLNNTPQNNGTVILAENTLTIQ